LARQRVVGGAAGLAHNGAAHDGVRDGTGGGLARERGGGWHAAVWYHAARIGGVGLQRARLSQLAESLAPVLKQKGVKIRAVSFSMLTLLIT
jgi:hypothetical protein